MIEDRLLQLRIATPTASAQFGVQTNGSHNDVAMAAVAGALHVAASSGAQ
jgi:hypothetical protein